MSTAKSDSIGVATGELFRGERIGRYEILTQLSVGGMAELFLAFTQGPGGFRKYVVIKRILPDAKNNDSFVRMFLDEARITGAMSHPNIAQVFELGGEDEGLFLAMEFIAGQNLNQISSACIAAKRRMPIGFCVAVVRDVLNALHYAHTFTDSRGEPAPIIHRDVAQKNVMVTYDGVVKLLDFGIAKAKNSLGKTSVGMVKGTTGYMSPEQVRGEEIDGRSDVFSAGITLFEILTGRRLFSAETETEEMERILTSPIPDPTSVDPLIPAKIAQVANKALCRDRTQRYQSAKAMAKALEQAAGSILFDQDRMASFMAELFEGKVAATRALLESAGTDNEVTQVRDAAALLRRDVGSVFPGEQVRTDLPPPPPGEFPPMPVTEPDAKIADVFTPGHAEVTARSDHHRGGWLFGVAALMLLGAIIAFRFLSGAEPAALAPPTAPRTGTAAVPPRAPAPAGTGTLTLITQPESSVSSGGEVLGRTPLIDVALPPGSHLLTVAGPDGSRRILTVNIREGENTALRVRLEELPNSAVLRGDE